tara:strand:+ start:449 stop:820 length:372 start_codon:yes stop_codon:yes gene_type:complete
MEPNETSHLNKISNTNFFNKRKTEELEDELNMLAEYVDEFAPHPAGSQFFDGYLSKISFEVNNPQKDIWGKLSLQEKVECYRQYIDAIGRGEDAIGVSEELQTKQPEASEWYDDWLTYSQADP